MGLLVLLVVVIPVVGFEVAASYEADRCAAAHPEGECDLAGVAGIAAVVLIYVVEVVLAVVALLAWFCFRLLKRRGTGTGADESSARSAA